MPDALIGFSVVTAMVGALGALWYWMEYGDVPWSQRERAKRRAKRRRGILIAMHMAAGMSETDAEACADTQLQRESKAARDAWREADDHA